jgi:hypothetical protein
MPMEITTTAGGTAYANPFVGRPGPTTNFKIDVSTLTTDEVDGYGYLKPGVPFQASGALVSGASQTVHLVTVEAIKLPGRTDNSGLSSDTTDPIIGGATSGLINRDIAEDNLGRAYTANELAALALGGFKVTTT